MNRKQKGKFITLEGIEGVGKSSNLNFISHFIQKAGFEVCVTREPGGTQIAEAIRQILLTEYEEDTLAETELLLVYAGRLQHVEHVIKPALSLGKWVVCDRFMDATYAYQGAGRGILLEKIDEMNRWVLGEFMPDCTIILDARVEVALARIHPQRDLDRFEKEHNDFFDRVRMQYLAMARHERFHVVNAENELGMVQADIEKILQGLLK